LALERYQWWITKGSGGTATFQGDSGSGATNGYTFGGGVALLLNAIDKSLAAEMDRDTGINQTFLYAEVLRSKIDDFGADDSMRLSPDGAAYAFGLLFVF
jgi:hypothetical protein